VELGGTDQRFNLLTGRDIQKFYGQEPQDIMMTNLLEGVDGRKMSSSWDNAINLTDEPNDMFGKVMSINDDLIVKYFELATRVPLEEIKLIEKGLSESNPRDVKLRLAKEIVSLYYGQAKASKAQTEWQKVFSDKEKPSEIKTIEVKSKNIIEALVETKLAPSKTEARRLIVQKGVKIDDKTANDDAEIKSGNIVQVGKRKFIRIK
jgi:tyrosyl-tRNA synthetase